MICVGVVSVLFFKLLGIVIKLAIVVGIIWAVGHYGFKAW